MRIGFFGTALFAVPALQRLAGNVVVVITQPDRPAGRGMRLQPSSVKAAALELGLSVETPENARNPEFVASIGAMNLDALLVAAYGQILSVRLLESAQHGGINLHGSILPKYRGAAPIQRCILAGDTETGVTLMQMAKGMDTGDTIAEITTPIGPDETYGELAERLAHLAADLAEQWMPSVASGIYPRRPQDHESATYAPKVEKAEAALSFGRSAVEEYRRFRAFTPSPGATLSTRFGPVRIGAARFWEPSGRPGTLLSLHDGCALAFAEGGLLLTEVQPEGKKRMSGTDFANGLRLKVGDSVQ